MANQFFKPYPYDQTDLSQSFQFFYNSYISQNISPICSYLYGINENIIQCMKCKTTKYQFQSYSIQYFPLLEAKKLAVISNKEKNKNFDEKNYILTLEDCFIYNEKTEYFTGSNSMYCSECKQSTDAKYQNALYTAPCVLSIVLNRGKNNLDFREKFIFNADLDIGKYLHCKNQMGKYYLMGVVVHLGESSESGHFIAYCRMDNNSKWFKYNDAFAGECKDFNEIINAGTPYILFYHIY